MINFPISLKAFFLSFSLLALPSELLNSLEVDSTPLSVMTNPFNSYSLINSVDCHPKENLFCATFTHANGIVFYKNDASGKTHWVQTLKNPEAHLSNPQHAIFSSDGKKLIVANWTNQTFTIYLRKGDGSFSSQPDAIIPSHPSLKKHKPHGIAMSPDGKFLGVAYGAGQKHPRAIALFRIKPDGISFELESLLDDPYLSGTPKGITFSPDGKSLLVTFSDLNAIAAYDIHLRKPTTISPRQLIQGQETQISRPEDVKISSNGKYCAVSNSGSHTITFYLFDSVANKIEQSTPSYILGGPNAAFFFPHGIAFSNAEPFLFVTEFGHVSITETGGIAWKQSLNPNEATIKLFKINL